MNKKTLQELISNCHAAGKKTAVSFCSHVPQEILEAAGICCLRLPYVGGVDDAASHILVSNVCPIVKNVCNVCEDSALADVDLIFAETSCDGKKKMYELLSDQKRIYFYQVGQGADREYVRPLIKSEVKYLIRELGKRFGVRITEDDIREAAKLVNEERQSILDLMAIQKAKPAAAWGTEIFRALEEHRTVPDIRERIAANRKTKEELLAQKSPVGKSARRVLVTGCPMSGVYEKIASTIESNGGVVVAFENCEVIKSAIRHFDTENEDIMEAFADCYQQTACAIMSPNTVRFDLIRQLTDEYQVDGVLDITLQTCHPYTVERDKMMRLCREELEIPYMAVETDVTDSDAGQLATRITAFLEMI